MTLARNVTFYYPYLQYTNLFIFRFVSLLCLRSTLRLYIYIRMITYGISLDLVTFLYSISRLQGSMIALQSKEAFLCRHQSCLNCFTSNNDAAKIICTLRKRTPNRNTKMYIAKKTPCYLKVIFDKISYLK